MPADAAVWQVAWPMILLGWGRSLYLLADAAWVAWLGEDAVTALSAATFAWWMVDQTGELAGTGTHSRVARAVGAGQQERVGVVLIEGLVVGAGLALVLAVTAPWAAEAYVEAVGLAPGAVRDDARAFVVAMMLGALGGAAQAVVGGVMRGLGAARAALGVTGLTLLLNILLDPLFIWGLGPVPAMGVAGAAVATAVSAGCGAMGGLMWLRRAGVRPVWGRATTAGAGDVLRVGGPMAVSGIGFSLVYVLLARLVAADDPVWLAVLGIGHRLESVCYLACMGIMVGVTTLVGQQVGAGDVEAAMQGASAGTRWTTRLMLPGAAIAWIFAEPLFGLFTHEPALVASGAVYLRIQATFWVLMGFEVVYEGAFAGAGRTVPALLIGAVGTAARVPAAWLVLHGLGLGIEAVWLVIGLSTAAKGVAMRAWFQRRGWVEVSDHTPA